MMKALTIEFYKTRRRKVWLIVFALIATQILWSFWGTSRMDASELKQGWMFCLYQFPLLNSIMMPVIVAVIASRLSDVEHKGQTLRLLETILPAGRLFDAKLLCGFVYMAATVILQVFMMLLIGIIKGFAGPVPVTMFGYYFLFTIAVNLSILLFQQVISLLFTNQMVALSIGLIGSFLGLFSMFFPQGFQKFFIWGYYGVLMFVGMNWDHTTRITDFYWAPIDWTGLVFLGIQFCLIYGIGRTLFIRKEL
jgi:lantibiotic transport system permease protein